eukprot:3935171-Rhodomonas_salina.1
MAGLEQQLNQLVSKLLRFYSIHTPHETVGSVHVKCQVCFRAGWCCMVVVVFDTKRQEDCANAQWLAEIGPR